MLMNIDVIGGSKSQKKHVVQMIEFCASRLMPRLNNLDITVNLCKPKGAMGYCLETDDKRTFDIEVDKTQPLRRVLETVAHEMVHVQQNLLYGMTSEGPAYDLEYELYSSWQAEHEPTK